VYFFCVYYVSICVGLAFGCLPKPLKYKTANRQQWRQRDRENSRRRRSTWSKNATGEVFCTTAGELLFARWRKKLCVLTVWQRSCCQYNTTTKLFLIIL